MISHPGKAHLDQGYDNSFPLEDDQHSLTVCRYVERTRCEPNWFPERNSGAEIEKKERAQSKQHKAAIR